mmetsp:Transcript_66790/g.131008  ORF Transcript_66790/g.131008 Transcript_66790/m.131008 type:complete len:85 (+) Transcript_66790:506-760(+)
MISPKCIFNVLQRPFLQFANTLDMTSEKVGNLSPRKPSSANFLQRQWDYRTVLVAASNTYCLLIGIEKGVLFSVRLAVLLGPRK